MGLAVVLREDDETGIISKQLRDRNLISWQDWDTFENRK